MAVTVTLPGIPADETARNNVAALLYAALHFCAQPGTCDQLAAFMQHHLEVPADQVPPGSVLNYLASQIWDGHAAAAGWKP
jgi:hypothetical protein